jgi:uncharacterized protein
MFGELLKIAVFIQNSIIHVWPYLLISVPLAVIVKMSGASKHIGKVFSKKPLLSVFLATIVGAFSPFCSCSVIPVIASLLIGGVPLAPVMSFWLASPSMDPEIFFLSVSVLGWQLAVWRLASAFGMSFFSGLITLYIVKKGWITEDATLKAYAYSPLKNNWSIIKSNFIRLKEKYLSLEKKWAFASDIKPDTTIPIAESNKRVYNFNYCDSYDLPPVNENVYEVGKCGCANTRQIKEQLINKNIQVNNCCGEKRYSFLDKLFKETFSATAMVAKFMILAYFLEALIVLYIPGQFITAILGQNHILSIISAAIIGIPVYTSSMPALAMVAGLISKGMIPAAGLAFLISGPTTTIPAMAAVWNLANRKVFFLYVGFTLAFAIISGLLFYALTM